MNTTSRWTFHSARWIRAFLCIKHFDDFPRHLGRKPKSLIWPTGPSVAFPTVVLPAFSLSPSPQGLCPSHTGLFSFVPRRARESPGPGPSPLPPDFAPTHLAGFSLNLSSCRALKDNPPPSIHSLQALPSGDIFSLSLLMAIRAMVQCLSSLPSGSPMR